MAGWLGSWQSQSRSHITKPTHLDVVNTYGRLVTETKTAYLHETGGPGCLIREVEERHNTVVSCGNKFRQGKD